MISTTLSIAGSDPSGGAGVQADLKTALDLGVYGMAVITAITSQNTLGVHRVQPIEPQLVLEQTRSVLSDMPVGAIKIGMVGLSAGVLTELLQHTDAPIILDPVLLTSSGRPLLPAAELPALQELAALACLITPNTDELRELLQGEDPSSWAQHKGTAVLHTGGHGTEEVITNWLHLPDGRSRSISHDRVNSRATHGTGCTLSAAIAAGMARGWPLDRAVEAAIHYTHELVSLSADHPIGSGVAPLLHGLLRAEHSGGSS